MRLEFWTLTAATLIDVQVERVRLSPNFRSRFLDPLPT